MIITYTHKKKLFKRALLLAVFILSLIPGRLLAQLEQQDHPQPNRRVKFRLPDTVIYHKNFRRAAIEFGFAELTPWTIDRYVRKADYARITWKSTGHNINPGSWEFDNDPFQTNQFGHPYHGSYFFSSMRANGYTFWQSVPAAFAGSYLWETFAENQAPAPNDFINTSYGGIILGEMTYRISNKIVNNRRGGMHRQVSEVIGLLINPINGINRILDGKWGKIYGNPTERDSSKITAQFDFGFRAFNVNNNNVFHDGHGWYTHARMIYGVPDEDYKRPFSNIAINVEVGKDDSTALNIVSVYGSLVGWDITKGDNVQNLVVISANYDYIHNASFFYGGQSVKANLLSTFKFLHGIVIRTSLGAGPVLLGAVPDPYMYRGRNYDYGTGFALNAGGRLSVDDKLFFDINYRGGWLVTINGNKSDYFLHTVSGEMSYMVIKGFSLCIEPGYFSLLGHYREYPNRDKTYPYFKAAARYTVNF